jgi:hypothetical protein
MESENGRHVRCANLVPDSSRPLFSLRNPTFRTQSSEPIQQIDVGQSKFPDDYVFC